MRYSYYYSVMGGEGEGGGIGQNTPISVTHTI